MMSGPEERVTGLTRMSELASRLAGEKDTRACSPGGEAEREARREPPPPQTLAELAAGRSRLSWLWPGWIPRGHLTVLGGPAGSGKSTVALDLAARLARGDPWPDGQAGGEPGGRTLVSDAEGCAPLWAERGSAWGVPLACIAVLGGGAGFRLGNRPLTRAEMSGLLPPGVTPEDLSDPARAVYDALERAEAAGPALVVIDSLRASLAPGVDESDARMHEVLEPWAEAAGRFGVALLILHHTRLGRAAGGRGVEALRGSTTIGAVARSVLLLTPVPGGGARLECAKSNFGPPPAPLQMAWGPSGLVWQSAVGESATGGSACKVAQYLKERLADGPKKLQELRDGAHALGCGTQVLYEAGQALGVEIRTEGRYRWWSLPPDTDTGEPTTGAADQ